MLDTCHGRDTCTNPYPVHVRCEGNFAALVLHRKACRRIHHLVSSSRSVGSSRDVAGEAAPSPPRDSSSPAGRAPSCTVSLRSCPPHRSHNQTDTSSAKQDTPKVKAKSNTKEKIASAEPLLPAGRPGLRASTCGAQVLARVLALPRRVERKAPALPSSRVSQLEPGASRAPQPGFEAPL